MLEGKAILVADDDLALSEMYQSRLKSEGAIVEVARDGAEALQMAEDNHPQIILLDVLMPEFNGLEVLKVLKENEKTRDIPVIVLTVLLESDKYGKAMALGADDYLVKSEVMPVDVVNKIKTTLAKRAKV